MSQFENLERAFGNVPVWDDHAWTPLPALDEEIRADVCVVGLGGSGLACVHELLAGGYRVAAVDAGAVGGGAAGRNGGFFLAGLADFYHDAVHKLGHERALPLYRKSQAEMDRMAELTPDLFRRTGSLRIAADDVEERDCALQLGAMLGDGLEVEGYEGHEGRGLLIPGDGTYNPLQRCRTLATMARRSGAMLYESSRAVSIAGTRVEAGKGVIQCGATIVAVDGNLAQLFPELATRMRSVRLQMLATAPDRGVHFSRPVYRRWGYDYWQQLADGSIALGGQRDAGGESEWTSDQETTRTVQARLEALLRDELKSTAPVTHRWTGIVSYSENGMPVVAEMAPNVWVTGAYNGTGNVIGSLCGRGLAQRVTEGHSDLLEGLLV